MRKSGVLLSVSSLPSKYGIGCFDEAAYKFVDDLVEAKQTYWQILPLGILVMVIHLISHSLLLQVTHILFH